MSISSTRIVLLATAAITAFTACSGDGADEFPSTNWTGKYATRVVTSSTNCAGSESPPPMSGFIMELEHEPTNDATIRMNPIIDLTGRFEGDHIEAKKRVEEPVSLPDSILSRATPADSIDVIQYVLTAEFSERGFKGSYKIRSPDLRSLVTDGVGGRCDFRYELEGQRFVAVQGGAPGAGATSAAPAESR